MAHAGIADDVIIEKIRSNGLAVHPSSDQLVTLKNQGLSDNVLVALVNARVGPPPAASGSTYDYSYSAYPGYSYPYYYSYPYFYGGWGYAPYAYGWGYWGGHYGCYPHYGYYHGGHVIIHH